MMQDGDAALLLAQPAFRRFLYAAIQSAGIMGHTPPANGQIGRDLTEGRRSLGFDLLRMADEGQPVPLRTPEALATLSAIILEVLNPPPKDAKRDRRDHTDRYDDLPA